MQSNTVTRGAPSQIADPPISQFLFSDTRLAPFWTILRLYLGYAWLTAGWGKLTNPAGVWIGAKSGTAVTGFIQGALAKTGGDHPDVSAWYAAFLERIALPNAVLFSYLVTYGEILVGVAGSGPPVLLLHGYPQTHLMWRHVAPLLARSRTVVVTDLRGYGGSTAPPDEPQHAPMAVRATALDHLPLM